MPARDGLEMMARDGLVTIDRDGLGRLVAALIADELGRIRGRPVEPAEWRGWTDATPVDEDGLGADSLSRLELAARLNAFFHMHEVGAEDYLLVRRTLGDWTDIVGQSLALKAEHLTFQTSGTTGTPRRATHRVADLLAEVTAQAGLWPGIRRVVALTPPHHIYGFLTGVLGPTAWGVPVLDARGLSPAQVLRGVGDGDLIAATPFLWDILLRSGGPLPGGATGLTSTAPAPATLWADTAARGLRRLVELYGSSETAGVGWRDTADAAFTPLGHLLRDAEGRLLRAADRSVLDPPDRLVWCAGGFRPQGRLDGAVQVGGVNVFPEKVRDVLAAHPAVAACAVRLDPAAGRLKGFVVPREASDEAALDEATLAEALRRHCAAALSAPERPTRFTFGPALPRTEMGKLRDWG